MLNSLINCKLIIFFLHFRLCHVNFAYFCEQAREEGWALEVQGPAIFTY